MKIYSKAILVVLIISLFTLGCGGKQSTPQQQAGQQAPAHTMEDPAPLLSQMNQTLDNVESGVKNNQMAQAKVQANNLVALIERLSPHFADSAFKDKLHHEILALRDELNKPSPNQAIVTAQIQSIRGMLKEAPTKFMTH